jgi:nucleoside-diphosphate-sugar epimerase
MNFLLTGGSGFIGSNLARIALQRGHRVRALVRRTSAREHLERLGAEIGFGDLFSGEGVEEALKGIDCVLHVAGATKARSLEELYRCNTEATRVLVTAAAAAASPPRFILCSSLAAAGPTTVGKPRCEALDPAPVSEYGKSKLAAEMIVRRYADRLPSVVIRPPIVYGPRDREFLPALLPMARLGLVLKNGFGPKHYSLVHVDDLCEGMLAASVKGKLIDGEDMSQGVYFLSDGKEHSWEQFCGALALALGKRPPRIIPIPEVASYAAVMAAQLQAALRGTVAMISMDKVREMRCEAWTCCSHRAEHEIGYRPTVALEEGLRQTIGWYRQEGWIS